MRPLSPTGSRTHTGQKAGPIDEDSVKRVAVDTTVMEKNIAYPTDARFYERARAQVVALAQQAGLVLWQSFARLAPAGGPLRTRQTIQAHVQRAEKK